MKLTQCGYGIRTLFAGLALGILFSSTVAMAGLPKEGDEFNDFELADLSGDKHKLSDMLKDQQVVLVVLRGYPGYQCPLCSKQATQYLGSAKAFQEADATVVMVYPGPADSIDQYAKEFIEGQEFPENVKFLLDPDYDFLVDNGLRWDAEKETSYPSTFLIGKDGVIKYAKISKTHGGRTKPKDVLSVIK